MNATHAPLSDILLRASVSSRCNFNCSYCPKDATASGGMENYAPDHLAGNALSPNGCTEALQHIRNCLGVRTVSFTGGEPTLNRSLPDLLVSARALFDRVEITTNGSDHDDSMATRFARVPLDLVKISLDATDPTSFAVITGVNNPAVFQGVIETVRTLAARGVPMALNAVVMRSTLASLRKLIAFARMVPCPIHLLDYVFYPSKRDHWETEFVPMEFLANVFTEEYGPPKTVTRYGCTFYTYNLEDIYIRFKDSMTATTRAPACSRCMEYCQEGPYGLKLSVEGWVTACPSIDPRKGVALPAGLDSNDAADRLATLVPMFTNTEVDTRSFAHFLRRWDLHPAVTRDEVRRTVRSCGPVTQRTTKRSAGWS